MNYLLVILFLFPVLSFSQPKWELKKNQNDIKVYVRGVEDSPFKEIMVKMKARGTINDIKEILLDVENHKNWVYNTKDAYVIKRINEHEVIYYTEVQLPWPVSNRDVNAHMRVLTDSIPNGIIIKANSFPGPVKPKSGIVRVTYSYSHWRIIQTEKDILSFEYIIRLDPGGNIPAWLVNATAINGPYHSFSRIKELLKEKI